MNYPYSSSRYNRSGLYGNQSGLYDRLYGKSYPESRSVRFSEVEYPYQSSILKTSKTSGSTYKPLLTKSTLLSTSTSTSIAKISVNGGDYTSMAIVFLLGLAGLILYLIPITKANISELSNILFISYIVLWLVALVLYGILGEDAKNPPNKIWASLIGVLFLVWGLLAFFFVKPEPPKPQSS